ncbi:Malonyl-[acyl-carrier protein] O-methyltransferase [Aquirufa nivalisilvae]|uniref:Malonyl-[acyl-carrier protein] O-methyltransferase n=1 Tax=Aquirufa nivalisilvae TaxID=2516557 RepID=A0A2S2DYC4_9BACT|nr:class I SAM-dependent methyltransferase [Aquirufa nivalisilvae]AWL10329.1 Malonyl-[acyl-carrier protein] O-methyltransferase [Aquirufa nivalisilvae]
MSKTLLEQLLINPVNIEYVDDDIPTFAKSYLDYSESFGLQWNKFTKTQLDSYTQTDITEVRLERLIGNLQRLRDKIVLEIGCGSGRFTEVLLKYGAKVVSVDMSTAVIANKKNFPISDNHFIVQADMNNLPFKDEVFDFIVCVGVLQHTPNTFISIINSQRVLKKGGTYVLDHYTHTLSYYTKTTFFFRKIISFFNKDQKYKIIEGIFNFFYPFHYVVRNLYFIQILLSRISPIHVYFKAYPELTDELQKEWSLLDTHDSLADPYKRHLSKRAINNFLLSKNFKVEYIAHGGNGVEARFVK